TTDPAPAAPAGDERAEQPAVVVARADGGAADVEQTVQFTTVEQAQIRNAVADYAAGYYGGPLGLGRDSAARYTAEGHLRALVDRHGLGAVWQAVAAVIEAEPGVLDRSVRERDELRAQR